MQFIVILIVLISLTNAIPHDLLIKPENNSSNESIAKRPLDKQVAILKAGEKLSEAITAQIVGPIVIFNSKVAAAAGALPPLMAANGAIIGSAIATPIEIGAIVGSSIASGVTGKLVSIPISLASGAAAKLIGAIETGKEIWEEKAEELENAKQVVKEGAVKVGHIMFKPIAVIVGAHTVIAGTGLKLAGAGVKTVGVGISSIGAKMMATGAGLKAKGVGLIVLK